MERPRAVMCPATCSAWRLMSALLADGRCLACCAPVSDVGVHVCRDTMCRSQGGPTLASDGSPRGETAECIGTDKRAEGRAKNRRVELVLR